MSNQKVLDLEPMVMSNWQNLNKTIKSTPLKLLIKQNSNKRRDLQSKGK